MLDERGAAGELDWSRCAIDSVSVRAATGGELTGPNPVDRGKNGSKIHLLTGRAGLPLSIGISAANTHDKLALQSLVQGIPPIRSQRLGHRHRWVVESSGSRMHLRQAPVRTGRERRHRAACN
ncbi:hypothetical protein GCM10009780_59440 [Actinomadura alba]